MEINSLKVVIPLSILLRILVAIGGYSGQNDPPKYGDFEAQRHWMELTVYSKPSEWYVESEFNDLNWWRLDYPPLSGYFAYFWGRISLFYDTTITQPYTSRGLESFQVKFFMRLSVFISELIFLYPALLILCKKQYRFLAICSPLLMLIDHGHFQYNCVMLGLMLYAVIALNKQKIYLSSILFVMALNFKIMALYFALPFFIFILSQLKQKSNSFSQFIIKISKVGLVVIFTFTIIWIPWINNMNSFLNTLRAIFPVHRGLYQLHVGTFWCISHVVIKWSLLFTNETLFQITSIITILSTLWILTKLFKSQTSFQIALFTVSQAFFLFSFHVHEKTILLPLMLIITNFEVYGILALDYSIIATITHHPLMKEDKLFNQYLFVLIIYLSSQLFEKYKINNYPKVPFIYIYKQIRYPLLFFYILLTICQQLIQPPSRYPFLYELLIQSIGFIIYSYVYFISHFIHKQEKIKKIKKM